MEAGVILLTSKYVLEQEYVAKCDFEMSGTAVVCSMCQLLGSPQKDMHVAI